MKVGFMLSLVIMLPVTFALPAAAQQGQEPCDIDLKTAAALLIEAQAQASSGQTADALAILAEIRAELDALISACSGETATPEPSATPADASGDLTATFAAANGTFTFNYPEHWVTGEFDATASGGTLTLATSMGALERMSGLSPTLLPGEQAMLISVGDALDLASIVEDPGALANVDHIITAFENIMDEVGYTRGERANISINDRRAVRLDFSDTGFAAVLIAFDTEARNHFGLIAAVAAPGELAALEPVALGVAQSLRYTGQGDN